MDVSLGLAEVVLLAARWGQRAAWARCQRTSLLSVAQAKTPDVRQRRYRRAHWSSQVGR